MITQIASYACPSEIKIKPDVTYLKQNDPKLHVKCNKCNARFDTYKGASTHNKTVHLKIRHICETCQKSFSQFGHLEFHRPVCKGLDLTIKKYNFACKICSKSFPSRSRLLCHSREVHTSIRKYVCDVCGWRSKSVAVLNRHRKLLHFPVVYKCNVSGCKKLYSSKYRLNVHALRFHKN